jgi:hypothetical protein
VRHKTSLAIIAIFLAQAVSDYQAIPQEPISALPQTRVNINDPDLYFAGKYGIVHQALFIYKLDAIRKLQKEDILDSYREAVKGPEKPVFDVKNMDIGRKGWTRYYPFSINGKNLTVRIFLTKERYYQPELPVLYEGSVNDPEVTFQVVPDIKDILKDCHIKPYQTSQLANRAVKASL